MLKIQTKIFIIILLTQLYSLCQKGCLRCQLGKCLICDHQNNFYLKNDICIQQFPKNCIFSEEFSRCSICEQQYFLKENYQCRLNPQKKITQCIQYQSLDKCKLCENGFYADLNGICQQIKYQTSNCILYEDAVKCSVCQSGYYLNNDNTCVQFQKQNNCLFYNSHFSCSKCIDQYFLNFNYYQQFLQQFYSLITKKKLLQKIQPISDELNTPVCERKKEIKFCEKHSKANSCEKCQKNYFLQSDNQCVKNPESLWTTLDSIVENCISFDFKNNCQICRNQFYLDTNGQCKEHIQKNENCLIFSPEQNQNCMICKSGFYRKNQNNQQICVQREIQVQNCKEMKIDEDKCSQCIEGFEDHFSFQKCSLKIKHCEEFDKTQLNLVCLKCENGFNLVSENCEKGEDFCIQRQGSICILCNLGYVLNSLNQCVSINIGNFKNQCKSINTNSIYQCNSCYNNDLNINVYGICKSGLDNCEWYQEDGICLQCKSGYLKQQGNCVEIGINQQCLIYKEDSNQCLLCKFPYVLNYNLSQCILLSRSIQKFNNQKCMQSSQDYFCQICDPGYMKIKLFEYQQQQMMTCQLKSGNTNLPENCLIFNQVTNKCVICRNGFFVNFSTPTNCLSTCGTNQQINLKNKQCENISVTNCQLGINSDCFQCQFNKVNLNKINYFQIFQSWNLSSNLKSIQFDTYLTKECTSTSSKFQDNHNQELVIIQGKSDTITATISPSFSLTQTNIQINFCDTTKSYKISKSKNIFQNLLTCFECLQNEQQQNQIVILDLNIHNRITDLPTSEQTFLTENSYETKTIYCSATVNIANCAIAQKLYHISNTTFECLFCKPGYKPLIDENGLISSCELIQNCLNSNTFEECDNCQPGYIFLFNFSENEIDKQNCISNTDNNCLVGSPYFSECLICKENYQMNYDTNLCMIFPVNPEIDPNIIPGIKSTKCENGIETDNCLICKDQGTDKGVAVLNYIERSECIPQFYNSTVKNKNCMVFEENLTCKICPIDYQGSGNDCINLISISNCKIGFLENNQAKCQICQPGYSSNQDQLSCLKNTNQSATIIQNCVILESDNSCAVCKLGYKKISRFDNTLLQNVYYCSEIIKPKNCLEISQNKFNSNKQIFCIKCQSQYILNINIQTESEGFCLLPSQIDNCEIMDNFRCVKCSSKFYLMTNRCFPRSVYSDLCKETSPNSDQCLSTLDSVNIFERTNQYLSEKNMQILNNKEILLLQNWLEKRENLGVGIPHCEVYSSASLCKYCVSLYYLKENACLKVKSSVNNCVYYKDEEKCEICKTNFLLIENECKKITAQNCLEFQNEFTCKNCTKKYPKLLEGICISPYIENKECLEFEQDKEKWFCLKCVKNYYPSEENCLPISSEIEFCEIYESPSKCQKCQNGYYFDKKNAICQIIQDFEPNCDLLMNESTCSICDLGYYLKEKECIQCPNSDKCDFCNPNSPTICLICKSGFYMNTSGDCVTQLYQIKLYQIYYFNFIFLLNEKTTFIFILKNFDINKLFFQIQRI